MTFAVVKLFIDEQVTPELIFGLEVFFPLGAAVFIFIFWLKEYAYGKKFTERLSYLIALGGVSLTWLINSGVLLAFTLKGAVILDFEVCEWINLGRNDYYPLDRVSSTLDISFGFRVDWITLLMVELVSFVAMMVIVFSREYMKGDPRFLTFMGYLALFVFAMVWLVTSDNYLQLFVGWELVGLTSYLLVGFWFTRVEAAKSAVKAILFNKIGDCFFLGAIALVFCYYGTLKFTDLENIILNISKNYEFVNVFGLEVSVLTMVSFCFVIAAMSKSAQFGLHNWLPDAMEGPTPVSALIHAATMVTAGVYLIIRSSFIFEQANQVILMIILVIGGITSIFGASTAVCQYDIKKIIAYSTCSQLGYMFMACGVSAYEIALFHLLTHGVSKALLFLAAGSVIVAAKEQDIRKMGALSGILPVTCMSVWLGSLSLMGVPGFSCYFSKELIIGLLAAEVSAVGLFAYILGAMAAFCTGVYSSRLLYFVFYRSVTNRFRSSYSLNRFLGSSENIKLVLPLIILSIATMLLGFSLIRFLVDILLFEKTTIYVNNLAALQNQVSMVNLGVFYKFLPLVLGCGGFLLMWGIFYIPYPFLYDFRVRLHYYFYATHRFFNRAWYYDDVMVFLGRQFYIKINMDFVTKFIENGLFVFIPNGLLILLGKITAYIKWENEQKKSLFNELMGIVVLFNVLCVLVFVVFLVLLLCA
jgi:NADH-quinone oxidoreductase subunit L